MHIYRVGGSVRDELLGLPWVDEDFVVVGATADELLAQGFRPVGKDFPVFLHPQTQAEYALARRERKTAPGHRGFAVDFGPEVTLEEDLLRRDLRVNAMARDAQGRLIDPFGGQADLAQGLLRHVSPAFVEDPLRVLRLARFAARWPHFGVAPDTLALMRQVVHSGELAHLSGERVWQEWRKGLLATAPQRLLEVLRDCGALPLLLPELAPQAEAALQRMAPEATLEQRYALLFWPGGGPPKARSAALKVPKDAADLARLLHQHGAHLAAAPPTPAAHVLAVLAAGDAFRRPQRFADLLQALVWAQPAALGPAWRTVAEAAAAVDAGALAQALGAQASGEAVAAALHAARCAKIDASRT